ncbi:trichoplein keratin filament-binding protein-like, partial [Cyprinus carpio]|uniref:Trichoplein keratin filament-binding protein n=1 Tax=Cyprinus carpio TaxID=7962 RepID=A0A9Q9Y447_CYPCA
TLRLPLHGFTDAFSALAGSCAGSGEAAGAAAGAGGSLEAAVGAALSVLQRAGGPQQQTGAVELTAVLPAQYVSISAGANEGGEAAETGGTQGASEVNAPGRERPAGGRAHKCSPRQRHTDQTASGKNRCPPVCQRREEEKSCTGAAEGTLEAEQPRTAEGGVRVAQRSHCEPVAGFNSRRKKQADERTQEEKRRFENEYERTRREALERMKEEEEKRRQEEKKRAEDLRKQMEELKLREQEAERLKQEQEALMSQRWELEKLEDERKRMEESRRKTEFGHFLTRQYRAQLKRRAQQVQEELEADRKILAALLEGEVEERRTEKARRERAVADAAWMKRVIEEQLQLEREREAEFDILYREEAQRVWEKREAEWEKERRARQRLMQEVLTGRQQQLEERMKENRLAREESLQRREELIQQLEQERLTLRQEREQQEGARTARMQEINAQVEHRRKEQWEEQRRQEQEELQEKEELRQQEEELRTETERMIRQGYKERIHSRPRSAWT